MPLVRIDLTSDRGPAGRRAIADAIHAALVQVLGIPPADRFIRRASRPSSNRGAGGGGTAASGAVTLRE